MVQPSRTRVERFSDTIEGRPVIRFDTYDLGPLGLRAFAQQVWADPETSLPMRIRKYAAPQRSGGDRTGDFSFPETGPSSIHDLGAPQDLPTVVNWGIIEKSKYGLSISYRSGTSFRKESYGKTDAEHNGLLTLEFPADTEQMCQWARGHLTLFQLCIYDGPAG